MKHEYIITISSKTAIPIKQLSQLIKSCKCEVTTASINNLHIGYSANFSIKTKWAYAGKFEKGFLELYNNEDFSKSILKAVNDQAVTPNNSIKYKASLICPTKKDLFTNIYQFFLNSGINIDKYQQNYTKNQNNTCISCVEFEINLPTSSNLTNFREQFTSYFDELDLDLMLEACPI